jgi:DNA-directed RNA polymerase subunit M/transcription elongation factor TFIIS
MESFRKKGIDALQTVLKIEKNISIIERNLFNSTTKELKKNQIIEDVYNHNLYQIIEDIQEGVKLKEILNNIKNKKIQWNHPNFDTIRTIIKEQNDFIENPFEVGEGVFQCKAFDDKTNKACESKRVFSYTKQDRSCDEGTSVYCECVKCGAKWRERG